MSINKIKKIINFLVKSELKNKNYLNESEDEPYGKILFSPQRTDNVDKTEPNTPEERYLKTTLVSHYFDGSEVGLSDDFDDLLDLVNKNKYTDILKPTPGFVYRILSDITLDQAAGIIGETPEQIKNKASNKPWIIERAILLNPIRAKTMSWTYNLLKLNFGVFAKNRVELIFEASTAENDDIFIMNPNAAKKIDFLSPFSDEYETVSNGSVPCNRVLVYYPTDSETNKISDFIDKYVRIINGKIILFEDKFNNKLSDFCKNWGLKPTISLYIPSIYRDINEKYSNDPKTKHETLDLLTNLIDINVNEFNNIVNKTRAAIAKLIDKDFNYNSDDVKFVKDKLGLYDPISKFMNTGTSFQDNGVEFFLLDAENIKGQLSFLISKEHNVGDIKKMIFRVFQRKQKI